MKKSGSSKPTRKVYEIVCYPPEIGNRKAFQKFEVIGTHCDTHSYPADGQARLMTVIYDNEDKVFVSELVWFVRVVDFIIPKNDLKAVKLKETRDGPKEPSEDS